ncbi:MAG: hypothetical protein B7Y80_20095 [Hyphomicrobium sp. 32-62-53]|nr:MAG: hypothetical protein B7Z29_19925 [Hyphomicrobium sp. 12-62-95]OYX97335.1 MAG: hypothetical protein B7Y80_20095 [Hyphomicrobium sp. 32-62-53]
MSNVVRPFAKRVAAAITGSPRQQIESIRSRRLELIEERKVIDGSRRPLEESQAALGRMLDDISASLDVDLAALTDHRTSRAPELLRPGSDIGNQLNFKFLLALLIASNRAAVRDTLAKCLQSNYDGIGAMTSSDRESKLNAIDAELDDLERREEAIIRETEADGTPLARRSDASPAIVLLRDLAA